MIFAPHPLSPLQDDLLWFSSVFTSLGFPCPLGNYSLISPTASLYKYCLKFPPFFPPSTFLLFLSVPSFSPLTPRRRRFFLQWTLLLTTFGCLQFSLLSKSELTFLFGPVKCALSRSASFFFLKLQLVWVYIHSFATLSFNRFSLP